MLQRGTLMLSLALVAGLTAVGCSGAEKKTTLPKTEPKVAAVTPAPAAPTSPGGSVSAGPEAPSSPIYFEFDSDQLTDQSQVILKQMADYLKAHPAAALTVEGHCDETGSSEYNLALGDRRARAAREYLRKLGVEEARLNTISYGEEKPAVAGADEKNRRGQFDLKG
jgi:peptidoglycan-associated lipoprotein